MRARQRFPWQIPDSGDSQPNGFGRLLRQLREQRGIPGEYGPISRRRLSSLIGYTESLIEKIELGQRSPAPQFVYNIARALQLNTEEVKGLIAAALEDANMRFLKEYDDVVAYMERQGEPNARKIPR